jgi:hypothetical protein
MKASKMSKGLLLASALLLVTSAFASNTGTFAVANPVTVSGKQLAAGRYFVKWRGKGRSVELNILQGKTIIATVPARLVDLNQTSANNAVVTKSNADGSRSLSELRFAGEKRALAIGEVSAQADSSDGSK